ncbi:MAG: MaoC/PaaZ C-terminal domain-containing protein [Polyangiaceae bacterium]|jgi:acyl dehydratase
MPLDLSLVGKPGPKATFEYSWKDTVLYALGVGAKKEELDYLYEGRGPKVLPSFAVAPSFRPMLDRLSKTGGNLAMLVHGGERVTLHAPIAPSGKLVTTATVRAIYDMRKFAQVIIDTRSEDAAGKLVAETSASMLFRGEGGFGGEPPPKASPPVEAPKDTPPTFSVEETSSPEQALLYRLSGDYNPLHADPDFARAVGFEQGPILHGLCTFGFMVRHAAKAVCGGDATRVTAFEAQFRRPVWPGETIVTEGWQVRPDAVALRVKVKGKDDAVIIGAWATLG